MAEIRPFRGLRYNQKMLTDLASVVCPPYDIITPQMQQALYNTSDYNIIRLEYSLASSEDTPLNNKYTRAGITIEQWLTKGILQADVNPAIYLHDHYFTYQGKQKKRRGIIASVKIEEWDKGIIHPHENTRNEAKTDRLNLLRTCPANLSPVFALYKDREGEISSLLARAEQDKPIIKITAPPESNDGETHLVWAITDWEIISRLSGYLAHQCLYIADGHHRYETALLYRKERHATSSSVIGEQAFDFIMMTLVEVSDPGLIILPLHRLIRGLSPSSLRDLRDKLKTLFDISTLSLNRQAPPLHFLNHIKPAGPYQSALGIVGLEPDQLLILKLRPFINPDTMPNYLLEVYKRLAVGTLGHLIVERWLGFNKETTAENIAYTPNEGEVWQQVSTGEHQLGVLLNPIKVDTVVAIADAGVRMPDKSTYFYPKPPTGLVIRHFEGI